MPIRVVHTPVGALGRAAVSAGRARGSQLQASRDIQLTSMALAAQGQRFAIEAREREGVTNRAFAMQQAASQMARQRPATGDALAERQQLRRTVTEAKAAGIYSPVQIKQMEIFSNLGDVSGVRSILGKVERPSARRQELQKQAITVGEIAQKNVDVIQRRLDAVNKQIEKDFSPEAQQFLRENPQFTTPEVQKLLAQQQQLGQEIIGVQQGAAAKQQALDLGISITQQMAFGERAQTRLSRADAAEQKRIDKQISDADKLTAVQRADISTERRHAKEIRDDIDREIGLLRREFGQYEDEDDDDYAVREQSLWNRISEFEGRKQASYNEERKEIQKVIGEASRGKGPGFLGTLQRPDGRVSTEISIGVPINGVETQIPSLVPTLTKPEINHLLAGRRPTLAIVKKAVAHAKKRIRAGKSPFAGGQQAPPKGDIFTTPDGRRYEFTGQYRNGQPWYEPVE